MTKIYKQHSFYNRKKAEYTAVFMTLLILYMIPGIIIELLTVGIGLVTLFSWIIYYLAIALLFLVLKAGYIHFVSNALMIAGLVKGFEYFLIPEAFTLYIHIALGLIMAAAIHVRKYQLYVSFFLFNIILIMRPFYIVQFIEEGLLSPEAMNQSIQALFGSLFVTITVYFLTGIIDREIRESVKLENIASTDSLTGLSNRRKLEDYFETANLSESKVLFVIDIDFFKSINDEYGHDAGDSVLKRFAGILKSVLRDSDTCYRWGGEEFVVILKGIDMDRAGIIAERMRGKVEFFDFGEGKSITISIGITGDRGHESLDVMLKRADIALFRAKEKGRNRIEVN